jgi:putative protease
LDFRGNVLNKNAEAFYRHHGVETIAPAAESGLDLSGQVVMKTKYCLREELGLCSGQWFDKLTKGKGTSAEPLVLLDEDDREYEVNFRCGRCGMEITFGRKK